MQPVHASRNAIGTLKGINDEAATIANTMPSAGHGTDMDSTKMNDNPFSAPSIDENGPKQIPKLLVPKYFSVGLKTFGPLIGVICSDDSC